jgi:hypothetical protein
MKNGWIFLVIVLLIGCTRSNPELTGIWRVESYTMNGTVIQGSSLGNPLYEFNDQGGYLIMASGVEEKGTFTLDEKLLTYHCTSQQKPDQSFRITRMDSVYLEYEAVNDSNQLQVKLIKNNR